MARLRVSAPDGERDVILGERLTVGRVEGVDLVLDDKGISRKHCEFERRNDGYVVRDLGSSNGTLVNGEKVTERALSHGDRVKLGSIVVEYSTRDADFALRFQAGEHSSREVPVTAARTTLGRRPDVSVAFVDVKVSGVHAEIVKEGGGYVLRDLGSTNGTFLDGRKVTEVALSHGDRVKLGENEFVFVDLRRNDAPVESAAAGAAEGPTRSSAPIPPARSKVAALVGIFGVLAVVGGAAAWYLLVVQGKTSASGRPVALRAPSGSLLVADWSFEDATSVSSTWSAELGEGFSSRRGRFVSGAAALAATVHGGHATVSKRKAESITGGSVYKLSGALAADDGARGGVGVRFVRAEDDATEPKSLTLVAATSKSSAFEKFEVELVAPAWAKGAEIVAVARGEGGVAIDDLALTPGGAAGSGAKLGELSLLPRGGDAFVLDHRAPLAELFVPYGSGTVAPADEKSAPTRAELPPPAFAASVAASGTKLTLTPGSGPVAAEGFAALLSPEFAAAGVTLLTSQGCEARFGAFEAAEVKSLLLGSRTERVELALSAPSKVVGVARGDALELRVATAAPLTVALRAEFDAERKEATELFAKAQEDWFAKRAGAALVKLAQIRDRLPYDDKTLELAKKLDGEIEPILEKELAAIESEAAAAEFLGSLERYHRTLARAQTLLDQTQGLAATKELTSKFTAMRDKVAVMEREQRELEARRLLKLARAYEAQVQPAPDRHATAAELLAELQRSYADTVAAKEARGEVAPAKDDSGGKGDSDAGAGNQGPSSGKTDEKSGGPN